MFTSELINNKIYAIMLTLIGVVPILVEGDATFLIFVLCISIPLFFTKDNWIT